MLRGPQPGDLLAGRYLLEREIEDGSGRWLARDRDGRRVAIAHVARAKVPAPEARRLLAFPFPGIVPLVDYHDLGAHDVIVEAAPAGEPTDTLAPLSPRQAAAALTSLAWTLQGVHAATGKPIGALDPSRMWIDRAHGDALVFSPREQIHFGQLTPRSCVGTISPFSPAYICPEMAAGRPYGIASDLFALGAVTAFWLAGEPPFAGSSFMEIVMAVLAVRRRPPRRRHALWDLVDALLVKEPAGRLTLPALLEKLEAIDLDRPPRGDPDPARRAALIAAVIADPDADGPRLVYADWLLDHGDARGELIQVQCELAHTDCEPLRRREAELLAAHGETWAHYLYPWAQAFTWRRGFVATVTVRRYSDFVHHRDALFPEGPLPEVEVTEAVHSGDGRYLLERWGSACSVYDLTTGEQVPLPHHVAHDMRFSRDSRELHLYLHDGRTLRLDLAEQARRGERK